jgi:hypothetical protein
MAQEFIKTADKIETPGASGKGERYVPPGDKTTEKDDEHLFRGLTRGGKEGTPSGNPHGIGMGGGRDVMTIISEGKGPMEADYKTAKVGSSLSGSGDPSRN